MDIREALKPLEDSGIVNGVIVDNMYRAYRIINSPWYSKKVCSISGGSDSDVMLDICTRCDNKKNIKYVFFDTGLEYQATKEHLDYLEKRYDIKIDRVKSYKSIPYCCNHYGQPFLSKNVSQKIEQLQKHNFKWEDKPFDVLLHQYPNCKDALTWWCDKKSDKGSMYNISRNKYLKEFMILNPPKVKFSSKCCLYAKKKTAQLYYKENEVDLTIIGVRKSEGGVRATAYKNCYSQDCPDFDKYRPLFWYTNKDKEDYINAFNIVNSDCYIKWGFKRTGCCGCPFDKELFKDLEKVKTYEPKLYKAMTTIFKDSYEYTKQYKQFVLDMKRKERGFKKLF